MKTLNILKFNILLFVFTIAFTCQSCTKNGSESLEGQVLEYGSNKPVANATVYLMEVKGTFLGPSGSRIIDSTLSNHEGKYKFTYMDNPYVSEIRGKANLYYENYAYIMGTGKKLKTDLILDPHAWLRIHVKSVNPVDENDAMTLQNQGCGYKVFKGYNVDQYHICTAKGNRNEVLKYTVSKIGQGAGVKHEINFQSGSRDTTNILLEY